MESLFFRVSADLGNLRSMLSSWPGVKIPGWRKPLAVIEFVPRSTTSNPNVFAVHVVRSGVGQWIVTRRATARHKWKRAEARGAREWERELKDGYLD